MSGRGSNDHNTFDIDKGIAALAYLVVATGESMYSLLKMMYLADKLHLQRYGRFIAGDRYSAMKQGPVPSNTYAIFQHLRGEKLRPEFEVARPYFDYRAADNHAVRMAKMPDFEELSLGEIKCLETIVETYKKYGKWAVRDLSHDDAWDDAWSSLTSRLLSRKSVAMDVEDIARQFEGSEALIDHLRDPFPGEAPAPTEVEGYSDARRRA